MRARLALHVSGVEVSLREVVLRDKPQAFLRVSPSATVPCLVSQDQVLDESLDIMVWALRKYDPQGWLKMPSGGWDWIEQCDGPFKLALDRTKYPTRYPDENPAEHREKALAFLANPDQHMGEWIFDHPTIADFAVLPFVRQFAFVDKPDFDSQNLPKIQGWLERFLESTRFLAIMKKYPQWREGEAAPAFP